MILMLLTHLRKQMNKKITIIGGCGHIGLPLGLVLADKGFSVTLYDIDKIAIKQVNASKMPFKENDAPKLLRKVRKSKKLLASDKKNTIGEAGIVIVTLDTPLDEHLSPDVKKFLNIVKELEDHFHDNQLIIFRSTLYPGATIWVHQYFKKRGKNLNIAFCPERISEGYAIQELQSLPQIVSGCTKQSVKMATEFFSEITPKIVTTTLIEAELAKLMTNTWRYISFAVANQFYMIANENDVDFNNVYSAMTTDYPRMKSFPTAGLAAGPCLIKDTMQLLNFANNRFPLGEAARQINEGLPRFIVNQIKKTSDLEKMTVGILGMAFKGNSDDPRQSLSYRLMKILETEAGAVLCNDPYIKDPRFVKIEDIVDKADLVIIAAPHDDYKDVKFNNDITLFDIWNMYGK